MKILYLDCFSGISGDMTLGALLELGLPLTLLEQELAKLGLAGYRLHAHPDRDGALAGMRLEVLLEPEETHAHPHGHHEHHHHHHDHHEHHHDHDHEHHDHDHEHDHHHEHEHDHHEHHEHEHHHHHEHPHRAWKDIRLLIQNAPLSPRVRTLSLRIFEKLALAEARMHALPVDDVQFHEVGAIDSIVDIVGVAIGLDALGIDRVEVSPLPSSTGLVRCAHGLLPLPAPATLELLRGFEVYDSGRKVELVTPTGAAIVAALAERCGGMPSFQIQAVGYGLGKRRGHAIPNALRAVIGVQGESSQHVQNLRELIRVLEASLDDLQPQLLPPLMEKLLQQGALDVTIFPVQMKKGRAGQVVQVLCSPEKESLLLETLFKESTTLGVRMLTMEREVLERSWEAVQTPWGTVRVKLGKWLGQTVNIMPEFEDCRTCAEKAGVPVKEVWQHALAHTSKQ
ncbi:MAG: nickel pincer cofactor biosynthesis protein LarC [Myxococcota bacterium]